MKLYCINYRTKLGLEIPIIATVIAESNESCLNILSGHLTNLSTSTFCDDSFLMDYARNTFVMAISLAKVFELKDKEEAQVIYYNGP
jgi:hypothetical protein